MSYQPQSFDKFIRESFPKTEDYLLVSSANTKTFNGGYNFFYDYIVPMLLKGREKDVLECAKQCQADDDMRADKPRR